MRAISWSGSMLVLMIVLGCAGPQSGSAPTGGGAIGEPVTIDDLSRVAGRWTGLMELPASRQGDQHLDLDLRPDGSYRATSARTIGVMDARGTAQVSEGKLLLQGERGARGSATLYAREGQNTLVIDMALPDGGRVTARLRPQR